MDYLTHHIEALVFCAPKPITENEIQDCLKEMFEADVPVKDIRERLKFLYEKYENDEFSFGLIQTGGGFQFLTKPAYQASISILLKQQSKKRLSNSALETLAIIAYKQPVTKTEIEQIRGVNCDYAIQKLLEKELIDLQGKSENVGRPILYGTSQKFMDYFGINSLKELPTPKDFAMENNAIGNNEE
jgi:segregation and condensation protein B